LHRIGTSAILLCELNDNWLCFAFIDWNKFHRLIIFISFQCDYCSAESV
jgi:hypothetical protein